ncbi:MAG: hypothetical protein M3220_08375 [Chloroflexota bacterium]|nr:hypothetical protein [Chloroflexota bacterium]
MQRMPYRGYMIQILWKAEHRYAIHIFPYQQANAKADRADRPGSYPQDIILDNADGSERYFSSVTEGIEAAKKHIDRLQQAALADRQR